MLYRQSPEKKQTPTFNFCCYQDAVSQWLEDVKGVEVWGNGRAVATYRRENTNSKIRGFLHVSLPVPFLLGTGVWLFFQNITKLLDSSCAHGWFL